jgi:hypothetical protein
MEPPSLDLGEFIDAVDQSTGSCTDLERLDVAVRYGELLKVIGDDVVGHFVERARTAGASWAQIGERLGVTKQAAHQRHFGRLTAEPPASPRKPFERFTPEARRLIVVAQEEARALRHNYVGSEHLLLALASDHDVGPLLEIAGAPKDAILRSVRDEVGEGPSAPVGSIPFTPRAKKALESAGRAAGRVGTIRPTHLLVGVLDLTDGVGASTLDGLGVSRTDLRRAALGGA